MSNLLFLEYSERAILILPTGFFRNKNKEWSFPILPKTQGNFRTDKNRIWMRFVSTSRPVWDWEDRLRSARMFCPWECLPIPGKDFSERTYVCSHSRVFSLNSKLFEKNPKPVLSRPRRERNSPPRLPYKSKWAPYGKKDEGSFYLCWVLFFEEKSA